MLENHRFNVCKLSISCFSCLMVTSMLSLEHAIKYHNFPSLPITRHVVISGQWAVDNEDVGCPRQVADRAVPVKKVRYWIRSYGRILSRRPRRLQSSWQAACFSKDVTGSPTIVITTSGTYFAASCAKFSMAG